MITHSLKIDQQYLENLKSGKKRCEIRCNDRDYQVGDKLKFYDTDSYHGSPREYVYFVITHIHSGFGMQQNYVALSVEESNK